MCGVAVGCAPQCGTGCTPRQRGSPHAGSSDVGAARAAHISMPLTATPRQPLPGLRRRPIALLSLWTACPCVVDTSSAGVWSSLPDGARSVPLRAPPSWWRTVNFGMATHRAARIAARPSCQRSRAVIGGLAALQGTGERSPPARRDPPAHTPLRASTRKLRSRARAATAGTVPFRRGACV